MVTIQRDLGTRRAESWAFLAVSPPWLLLDYLGLIANL